MRVAQGTVVVQENNQGVGGLTVTLLALREGVRERVGSTSTDANGRFRLEYEDAATPTSIAWNLTLEVAVEMSGAKPLYVDAAPRGLAGAVETWNVRLPLAVLVAAGVIGKQDPSRKAAALPALGTLLAQAMTESAHTDEVQAVVRERLDPVREAAARTAAGFRTELVLRGRGDAPVPPNTSVTEQVLTIMREGTTRPAMVRPRVGYMSLTASERAQLEGEVGPDGTVPPAAVEPLLEGPARVGTRIALNLLLAACRSPRTLDEACPDPEPEPTQPPPDGDPSREVADAVWAELHPSRPTEPGRPSAADVWRRVEGLDLTSGPSDSPAVFDFDVLHVPFEDVWRDLVDDEIVSTAAQLHDEIARVGGRPPAAGQTGALDGLRDEARLLAREAPAAMKRRLLPGGLISSLGLVTGLPDPLGDDTSRWVSALLEELERKIQEPYRFTVYGADDTGTAINLGLVTTYRQVWQPLSYQAGRLVETITLAPREERTYSRKVTTSSKRRTETKEKFRAVTRSEEQSTQRAVRDIVATAEHRTHFGVDGSSGPINGQASVDDGKTSSDTRQSFREAVRKASAEYESDRSVEVSFETSEEIVGEQASKLVNPNDELAVTYLFYQLQRRFHVSERLHRITPVVLVAQPVPRPNQINITWILQHDWILRRALLDRSFAPALDVVTGSLVGEESTVGQMRANMDQQRLVVAALKDSLVAAHQRSDVLFQALQRAIRHEADPDDPDAGGDDRVVDKVIDWLFGSDDEEENQRRLEAAREALDRSEANERAIAAQLQRDQSTLTVMTDKWAAASRALLDKTVEVQRLRLHIKQNVLYYMQAIWDHEPPDQRYFRLHQVKVPVVTGSLRYRLVEDDGAPPLPPHWTPPTVIQAEIDAQFSGEARPLGQIADLDRPLGYKGNYAIFPLRDPDLITRFLMVPYVDRYTGAHDPDHLANLTRAELEEYFCCLKAQMSPEDLAVLRPGLDEAHRRLITDPRPLEEVIVVPTDALFIAALPADQPLLEDFKLRHRKADAEKAEADAARARLDNVRRGARILAGELGDPDIEKLTVIQGSPAGVVVPGDEPS